MNDMIPVDSSDVRPLPLIVAEKWDFALAYVHADGEYWFHILDWVMGVLSVDVNNASQIWTDVQRNSDSQLLDSIQKFPTKGKNNKTYMMYFASDKVLYLLVQGFRATKNRPLLKGQVIAKVRKRTVVSFIF